MIHFSLKMSKTSAIKSARGLDSGGRVQQYLDSEVIRRCSKYVPLRDGYLMRSAKLGTVIGSGEVVYKSVYARKNYYENGGRGKDGTAGGGLRGRLWLERMKANEMDELLKAVKKETGV